MAAPTGPLGTKKRKGAPEGTLKGAAKGTSMAPGKPAGDKRPRVEKGSLSGDPAGKGKPHWEGSKEGNPPLLDRKARKEAAEARKMKRKPNYELEKSVVGLWEKLRQRNIEPAERSRLVTGILQKIKGKLCQLAVSHTSSRVVQTCVKYSSAAERAAIFEELRPHCVELARNTYAHHLVNKMLDTGSKEQRQQMLSLFHGHTVALLRHPSASHVVERAYQLANGAQKQALLAEFYSPEFRLFTGIETKGRGRLADLLAECPPAKKRAVLEHLTLALQPIVEKGIVDHSLVHRALAEFLQEAPKGLWLEVVQQLSGPLLVRMLHTRDGAFVASTCVAAGSAKERKKIVKGLKEHVSRVAQDDHGNLVLLQILDAVDDTLLVRKMLIAELLKELLPLALHKYGRRVLLHLLAPRVPRYFPADVIAALQRLSTTKEAANETAADGKEPKGDPEAASELEAPAAGPSETEEEGGEEDEEGAIGVSKKDPEVRRWELLHDSKLAQELASICASHVEELLRSQHGTDVIYEVASGGTGGILWRSVPTQLPAVHQAIAELASWPRPAGSKPQPGHAPQKDEPKAGSKRKKGSAPAAKEKDEDRTEATPGGEKDVADEEEEHVLDHFFASRTIRRLVLEAPLPPAESEGQPFAAVLWGTALAGRCHLWADGHSAKVVAAMASCKHEPTRAAALAELRPLVASGSLTCVQRLLPAELLEPATGGSQTESPKGKGAGPEGPSPKAGTAASGVRVRGGTGKAKKKGAAKSEDDSVERSTLSEGLTATKKQATSLGKKMKNVPGIAKTLKRKG